MNVRFASRLITALVVTVISFIPRPALATDTLCDASFQDCRAPLIQLIRQENVRIDVAFWFMEDSRFSAEIIRRWQAGVPVRVIIDQRAFPALGGDHPVDAQIVQTLVNAGIPIRQRSLNNPYILHWKTMIFQGQNTVEFSGANYSPTAFVPQDPYRDYEDEAIYFTDDASIDSRVAPTTGGRTLRACSIPGTLMSTAQRCVPSTFAGMSSRCGDRPTFFIA